MTPIKKGRASDYGSLRDAQDAWFVLALVDKVLRLGVSPAILLHWVHDETRSNSWLRDVVKEGLKDVWEGK